MSHYTVVFVFYTFLILFFRFSIGVPATSTRMQTKFKYKAIPSFLSVVLFFSTSKKPVSLHCIVAQIVNYCFFILMVFLKKSTSVINLNIYINCLWYSFLIIIVIPLVAEITLLSKKNNWISDNGNYIVNFKTYKLVVNIDGVNTEYDFSLYLNNLIELYYHEEIEQCKIDYKSKCIQSNTFGVICFNKNEE